MSFLQNAVLGQIIDNMNKINISNNQQTISNNNNNELVIKSFIKEQTDYLTKIYNDSSDNIIVIEDNPYYHYSFDIISNYIKNNYSNFTNKLITNVENNINRSLQPNEIIDVHTFIEYYIEFN